MMLNKGRHGGEQILSRVLPELATTGYSFNSRAEAYAHSEKVPTAWSGNGSMDQLIVQVVAALLQQMHEYFGCGFATDDAALLSLEIPGPSETS